MFAPLFLAEIAAAIYLVIASPKKLRTFGRMGLAFVVTLIATLVPPAVLRIGDPRAWGQLAGVVAPLVAVIVGWLDKRSLQRSGAGTTLANP